MLKLALMSVIGCLLPFGPSSVRPPFPHSLVFVCRGFCSRASRVIVWRTAAWYGEVAYTAVSYGQAASHTAAWYGTDCTTVYSVQLHSIVLFYGRLQYGFRLVLQVWFGVY